MRSVRRADDPARGVAGVTTLLSELGKKLADRWLTTLVLPGLLFVAAVVVARLLGHRHALDTARLAAELDRVTKGVSAKPAVIALLVVGVLLAATAAGLLTQAVAAGVRRTWTARRPKRRKSAASAEGSSLSRARFASSQAAPLRATAATAAARCTTSALMGSPAARCRASSRPGRQWFAA